MPCPTDARHVPGLTPIYIDCIPPTQERMLRAVQAVSLPVVRGAAGWTVYEGARRVATCGAAARMAFNGMDTATLDLQYSPSRWVKRVPAEVAVQQHMDDAVARTWAGTRAATSAGHMLTDRLSPGRGAAQQSQ